MMLLKALLLAGVVGANETSRFHVCGAGLEELNGLYEIDEEAVSDNAPVYTRVDGLGEKLKADYRLFRHQGFWAFADFSAWPPQVAFRCDPTQPSGRDTCYRHDNTPPFSGYTPRVPDDKHIAPPTLQLHPCTDKQDL
ncbi:hypothetical protein ACHHYP_20259 [Achlya hypogyna]|uniref:Secreted protein n=1 Tax=Achlya hypogyna TaxID=1202772 RepID=A0A1V9YU85_ACHHY|nr:hypothetical protein ACHHYP_20259 [Achlya hypogyna]